MARKNNPTPKTQKEISISLQTPTEQRGVGFQPIGNPNDVVVPNRAQQTSFDGDDVKPFSIGIQDIDEAVMYYFKNVIQPFVIQNGERLAVPIIYGSPEKWKSFQKDGYYRDVQGRIMAPIIMFKLDSISKNRTIANKLDANMPNNFGVFTKKYSQKNTYDQFSVLNNVVPEQIFYATVVPDYLTVTYSCAIMTYYVEQLNKIIEAVEYASDSYWGDPEKFKFQARIDSFDRIHELSDDKERVVKTTFSIKLNGHIVPDVPQKDINAIKKFTNKSKLVFTTEVVNKI